MYLQECKETLPGIPLGLITWLRFPAHRAGLEVLAWSPNAQDAVELAAAGVDALSVNDIPGVLAALAATARLTGKANPV